jgi:hypothetical protein
MWGQQEGVLCCLEFGPFLIGYACALALVVSIICSILAADGRGIFAANMTIGL